jgi:predicted NAD/FAD-binding protein
LNAAGKYGVAAAFAAASVGSSAVYGILGISTGAVPTLTAALVETTVKALGQSLATQAIQSVQGSGLNFTDLASNTASKDTKQAILTSVQQYLTTQQMQGYLNNGLRAGDTVTAVSGSAVRSTAYDDVSNAVAKNYSSMLKNLGSALTLQSLSGSISAQGNIDAIRALDNEVSDNILTQQQQLDSALNDLSNARDALNYCPQQHPDNTPSN